MCGIVHCYANRPEAAIPAVERAMRLSPLDPLGSSFKSAFACALMLAGRYEEATEWVDRSLHDRPHSHFAVRIKAALWAISAALPRQANGLPVSLN